VYLYTYMCKHMYIGRYILREYIYICICIYIYVCICVNINIYICIYYIYIYTYVYIHILATVLLRRVIIHAKLHNTLGLSYIHVKLGMDKEEPRRLSPIPHRSTTITSPKTLMAFVQHSKSGLSKTENRLKSPVLILNILP
jgi:hypothetical protein